MSPLINKRSILRFISYAIFLISILSMPWWFSLILAAAFLFYFKHYYEAVFFALLSDIIYSVSISRFDGFVLVSFSIVLVLAFLIEFLKKRMAFDWE